jgi:hypothetical protein
VQKTTRGHHLLIALFLYTVLASISFKDFLLNRFDRIAGNFGDNRLCIFLLEHWFRVFRGIEHWGDPRFFYPAHGVLGYSETMFLGGLPYTLFRLFGHDAYVSFELTLILASLCGYVSMIHLFRRWLDTGWPLSIAGAAIFSLSNVSHLWAVSAQTYSVMLLPSLLILVLQLADPSPSGWRSRRRNSFLFCALVSVLFFSTFYIAYFCSLLLILTFAIYPLLARAPSWRVPMPRLSVLAASGCGLAVGFIPFFLTYGANIAANHGWEFLLFLANAMEIRNVLDPGAGNLVWGRLLHLSGSSAMAYGVPPMLALIFIGTTLRLLWLSARGQLSRRQSALLATALATILLLMATVKYHDDLFWYYCWNWLPGARVVRVLPRLFIVASLFITIVSTGGLCELMGGDRSGKRRHRIRQVLLATVAAALILEQVNLAPVHGISRKSENSRLGKMPLAPSSCRSVFLAATHSSAHPIGLQLDVMLLAQRNNLPTVNGYGGLQPQSWLLNIPQDPDYTRHLEEWLDRYGIAEGSCGADMERSAWIETVQGNRNP